MSGYDAIVIGSGPAGHKAAIQGAKAGKRVLVIDQEPEVGGACVQHGTIPSKTLRETAVVLGSFRNRTANVLQVNLRDDLTMASLMTRKDEVIRGHQKYLGDQLTRNGVELWRGRARFTGPHEVEVRGITGDRKTATGQVIVIATGSHPRKPDDIPVDHEHILDSDSILSMTYLPTSLTVLGAGVIASEYASIFASLGSKVTMVDSGKRPVSFLDPELTDRFVASFTKAGGTFIAEARASSVEWDGTQVVATLTNGQVLRSEKMLVALGRVANLEALNLPVVGLQPNARGHLPVNEHGQTAVPHIYAAGDAIGPPALASTSMEQGRRAMCHALGLPEGATSNTIPLGVYTIPEMSSVGLSEAEARAKVGEVRVGRARFEEVARGQIAAVQDGLLKLVADARTEQVLGVQIVGEGAAELVHLGQMALLAGARVDLFIDTSYNFPTLAEAYRVAALDIAKQRKGGVAPLG